MLVLIFIPFVIMGLGILTVIGVAVLIGVGQGTKEAAHYWANRWRYRFEVPVQDEAVQAPSGGIEEAAQQRVRRRPTDGAEDWEDEGLY